MHGHMLTPIKSHHPTGLVRLHQDPSTTIAGRQKSLEVAGTVLSTVNQRVRQDDGTGSYWLLPPDFV